MCIRDRCRKELHVYAHIFVTKKRNVNEQIEIKGIKNFANTDKNETKSKNVKKS